MKTQSKLLIIEDEPAIRMGLEDTFIYHGFQVASAENGRIGYEKALSESFDLILLDVMLPEMNGYTICEAIREKNLSVPIIMLTARSADDDVIRGLALGADDYVSKPFSIAQLVLRVQAVLRRCQTVQEPADVIKIDSKLSIDLNRLCYNLNDKEQPLTRREADVIFYLYQQRKRAVSREELLHSVWGYAKDLELETRTVDIHIAKLRRKLEDNQKLPERIKTIRGAGYQLICAD